MKPKIYGNTKTHLRLTGKAFDFYSVTSPLIIEEFYNSEADDYIYRVTGAIEADGITEQQLVRAIEDLEIV